MRDRIIGIRFAVAVVCCIMTVATAFAGFTGTEVFLPSVGAKPGVPPSIWYTTVWVHNPNSTVANVTFYLLERQANPAPLTFTDIIQPGDTAKYENAIQLMFAKQTFGALRITSNVKVMAGSRIYSQSGELKDSVGQFFAGTPASFAIGAGQSTELVGVYGTLPSVDSTFRYNFGFVETTGTGACEVKVTVRDPTGTQLGDIKTYALHQWEQMQKAFASEFPTLSTQNARLTVEVTSGTGKVIVFGSNAANGSQDPATFEMLFRDDLLAENASTGGLTEVKHDTTLTGAGTTASVLGLANESVTPAKLNTGPLRPQSGQVLTLVDSNLRWNKIDFPIPFNRTETSGLHSDLFYLSNNGGGRVMQLVSKSDTGLWVTSTSGMAIDGQSTSNNGIHGSSGSGIGVLGTSSSGLGIKGAGGSDGVYGEGPGNGVHGKSAGTGVYGETTSGYGVVGKALATGTVSTTGVWGQTNSIGTGNPWHDGVGDTGTRGVVGWATATTGNSVGIWGQTQSASPYSRGVVGVANGVTGETFGVWGESDSNLETSSGVYGRSGSGRGVGVKGISSGGIGISAESADGTAFKATSEKGAAIVAYSNSEYEPAITATQPNGFGVAVFGNARQGQGVSGKSTIGYGVAGRSDTGKCVWAYTDGTAELFAGGVHGVGTVFRVDNAGKVFANGGYATGGADVAEFIASDHELEGGDVVEIDPDSPGRFRLAATASSPAVAGVISTDPGLTMNSVDPADSHEQKGPRLALVGRVPVKVSAENGGIRPGDLLVASALPGHAMRAPAIPAPGTVIGKALGCLDSGTGTVEMLVMLR